MGHSVTVSLDQGLRSIGRTEKGHETVFDTSVQGGGMDSAASPVDTLLEAAGACSIMDIVGMLRKRQKNVIGLTVEISGERRTEEPRIFTRLHLRFHLISPDATKEEFDYCIRLSEEKYCSVLATLKLAGANITSESMVDPDASVSHSERASMSL
jgi:putative redox protein